MGAAGVGFELEEGAQRLMAWLGARGLAHMHDTTVSALKFGFPGMRILQFAFAGDASDRFLPHNHEPDTVVYTGTHDNDTSAGWWATATDHERYMARGYLATDGHDMPWTLIRAAMASVVDTAVHPMQDVLALPTDCRMNFPGQESGRWR